MKIFKRDKKEAVSKPAELHCSFCSKSEKKLNKLIAGPNVYICDECINLCNDILADERGEPRQKEKLTTPSASGLSCALCHLPVETDEAVMIPDRGPICPACLDAIRAATEEEK